MRKSYGHWLRSFALIALAATWACRSSSHTSANDIAAPELDSLMVRRGACYGICDVYALVLRRTAPSTRISFDNIAEVIPVTPRAARRLLADAVTAGVLTLPPVIRGDSALCRHEASDHSTITLTAYRGGQRSRVEHYTGCYASYDLRVAPALERLVVFERQLQSDFGPKP